MFSNPNENVLAFGFMPGQAVADFGSGAGHYALALSKALGEDGRVYAVDIQEDMLSRLGSEARTQGRENIRVIIGDIEKPKGTMLKDGCVDGVVFSNILFQLADKVGSIKEAFRILKPGGRACVVEWQDLSFLVGVKQDNKSVVVSESECTNLFVESGFVFDNKIDAGDHHYGLIFKK